MSPLRIRCLFKGNVSKHIIDIALGWTSGDGFLIPSNIMLNTVASKFGWMTCPEDTGLLGDQGRSNEKGITSNCT